VINLHQEDLKSGYAGAFLPNRIEKKYKNAARELVWQWFFPAKTLTFDADKNEYRYDKFLVTHIWHPYLSYFLGIYSYSPYT